MNKLILSVFVLLTKLSGSLIPTIGSKNWSLYKLRTLYYTRTLPESEVYSLVEGFLEKNDSVQSVIKKHN